MGEYRCLEDRLGLGEPLDVIDVGVRGNERLALRQREVQLADEFDDLVNALFVADVDQRPVTVVVHEVYVAADPPAGLVVHFNHTGEDGMAFEHGGTAATGGRFAGKSR